MKQRFINYFILLLVTALALPSFLPAKAQETTKISSHQNSAQEGYKIQTVITVTSSEQAANTFVSSSQQLVGSCFAQAGATSNLTQDAGVVNLNQPANCFDLQVSGRPSLASLSVQPLVQTQANIYVLKFRSTLAPPNFLPAPSSNSLPLLPAAVALLIIVQLAGRVKTLKKLSILLTKNNKVLNFYQLGMMKC